MPTASWVIRDKTSEHVIAETFSARVADAVNTDRYEAVPIVQHLATLKDHWIPACGGTEQPFQTRSGRTLLYCWNPGTGKHAYLDTATDLILSDEEATAALAMF
jgi:hypothetical protein